jgi:hypothetical protein
MRDMSNPLVEEMAERFVHEVHDLALSSHTADFFGTWAVVQNNRAYEQVVAKLNEAERDVLWEMIGGAITRTIDATLRFVDHKHATGEMRIVVRDPATAEEVTLLEDKELDLPNDFWFEWFEKYAQVRERPKTTQHYVRPDDIPGAVRTAVTRDFQEAGLQRVFREIDTQRRTLAYHVMWGQERQATYGEDGQRR